ncbi:hypothetical protein CRM22_002352 [Opisthorchis felineus]|uniref:FZ domain-containing protein n=1 Tax=Opisthorchis felineus TaxID=147828 RepID=A0A4S2MAW1_OPIFE|nr:hypothetical protein CRM22_002352 [Opisthorchis felineus]
MEAKKSSFFRPRYFSQAVFFLCGVVLVATQTLQNEQANSRWIVGNEQCTVAAPHCVRIPLSSNGTCLGNHLPYRLTAPHPVVEDVSHYQLHVWTPLRAIPTCWDKLQFLLCSVYFPECMETQDKWPYQGYPPQVKSANATGDSASPPAALSDVDVHTHSRDRLAHNPSRVVLPEAEMCEAVHKACPLLLRFGSPVAVSGDGLDADAPLLHPLPRFFDCSLYPRGCRKNKLTSRLFQNNEGDCEAPLVTTAVRQNWIPGIERCSFPCQRPHFHLEHYRLARWLTGFTAVVCLLINVAALLTLRMQQSQRIAFWAKLLTRTKSDTQCSHITTSLGSVTRAGDTGATVAVSTPRRVKWTKSGRQLLDSKCFYLPLFYIHLFFLIGCLGWLMPLLPAGIGEMIACRLDGSLRVKEPQVSSGQSLLCILNFILIYFSLVAVATWSTVLDYLLLARTRRVIRYVTNSMHAQHAVNNGGTDLYLPCSGESIHVHNTCPPSATNPISQQPSGEHVVIPSSRCASPEKTGLLASRKSVTFPPVDANSNPVVYDPNSKSQVCLDMRAEGEFGVKEEIPLDKPTAHQQSHQGEVLSNEEPGENSNNAGTSSVAGETKLTSLSENTTPCRKMSCTKTVTPRPIVFHATQAAFPFIQTPCRSRQRFHPPTKQSLDHPMSSVGFSDAFGCPKCVAVEVYHGRRHLRSKSPPSACLHLVAFAIPFVLVLISLTVAEIDGDSLSGICVVGRANIWARLGLVLIPFSICLCVKCAYLGRLIHQMNELRRRLSKSPFIMDQDCSHRFGRCAHSYGIFLIALICLWTFSVGVQSYVLVSEPAWLSSQRSLVLCRLRYRLLGLDENSAHLACMNTNPSVVTHTNSAFKRNNYTFQAEHSDTPTVQSFGDSQSTESIQKPRTGPILLHLLSYFALNLIFASVCLLDRSVKYCWYASFRSCFKFVSRKVPSSAEQGSSNINVAELIETLLAGEIGGFSWWDPGIFNLPYNPLFVSNMTVVDDRCSCLAPQQNSDTKLGSPCKSPAQKKPRRSVIDSIPADTNCLSHSIRDFPSQFASVPSPSGIPNEHDLMAQLARLISYYENSAPDDPALILFRHLRQQLMASVSSSDHRSTQSASLHAGVSQSMTFASTSHAGIPAPLSSVDVASSSFPGLPSASTHPDLVASVAAVYEQCQKQLSTLTDTTSRRRNRHRRVISGRTATGNRRGYSRSLSTTGIFFPASSTVGSQKSGPSSVVSAAGSEQPGCVNDESLSLIRAAASVFAAASLRGSLNRKPRRNNQSGFDGSQTSSSSMRSALTRITAPNTSNAAALSDGHGNSTNDRTAPSNSRWSVYPDTNAAAEELGSRMSLRSLSCASSSGAESYNSYRLLVNQAGASWRELWRTRMLLMDVLRWVEVVAPMMQLQRKRQSSDLSAAGDDGTSLGSQEPLPQHKSAMNWEAALASLVSTLSLPQQSSVTSCQPQQPEGTAWSSSANYENAGVRPTVSHDPAAASLNPMLAAAFAAATAAATLALQHQNEVAPSREPPSTDPFCQNNTFSRSPAQQQQQIFPPKMSPAVHLHPVWSDQYPMTHPHSWSEMPAPPVPPNPPVANVSQSPVCAPQLPQFPCSSSSVRFTGAPDLLLDHDRYRLTAFSPSCTPPFVPGGPSPRTPSMLCRSPPSVPFPYLIPTYASWQQVPFRSPFCPPPASQVQDFPIQNTIGSVVPPVAVQYVPTETGESMRSKSLHDNGSNDSDAFDSEEEVISDDETPGMTGPKLSPANAHPHVPHVCQVAPDNFTHDFSQYPHTLESSRYCPPSHFHGEPFFNSVDRSLVESDIVNVDDGDISSVSQSASQVAPRESSPSSALPTAEDPEDFTSEPPCSPSQALAMNDKLPHRKRILDGVETTN